MLPDWKAEFVLGIAEIDAEHFQIHQMIERLDAAQQRPDAMQAGWAVMDEVVDYLDSHIKHEESLMEKSNYPALATHRAQHLAFEERVRQLRAQATLDTALFLQLLQEWLTGHVLDSDRAYVPYVQNWMAEHDACGGLE
jgi:hemerythrin